MKPIIGITCPWSEETWGETIGNGGFDYAGRAYSDAIYAAGGIPFLIPVVVNHEDIEKHAAEIFDVIDGLYFTGGGNVRPRKENILPTLYNQQPIRSVWEDYIMKIAYKNNIPTLGVCRGYQMMAVALGGSMDTVRMLEHKQTIPYNQGIHNVVITPDSLLKKMVGSEPWLVNSIHVERVGKLPKGFVVSAVAEDGSIEAIEATDKKFFMGTQFHPELMSDDARAKEIFKAMIDAAKTKKCVIF
ncbi:MAG: gamma-glutamyl-gamma-aminobutyrate hydrolase family protein [Clostridia bacterium]|nr:gamma-glutamyl-gamma-aminobutyrate hydrolase family protein [Clostridia bacterium]